MYMCMYMYMYMYMCMYMYVPGCVHILIPIVVNGKDVLDHCCGLRIIKQESISQGLVDLNKGSKLRQFPSTVYMYSLLYFFRVEEALDLGYTV